MNTLDGQGPNKAYIDGQWVDFPSQATKKTTEEICEALEDLQLVDLTWVEGRAAKATIYEAVEHLHDLQKRYDQLKETCEEIQSGLASHKIGWMGDYGGPGCDPVDR